MWHLAMKHENMDEMASTSHAKGKAHKYVIEKSKSSQWFFTFKTPRGNLRGSVPTTFLGPNNQNRNSSQVTSPQNELSNLLEKNSFIVELRLWRF